ncbi:Ubiquitin Specific Protease [Trichostrongylus colubriformis]|uniref:Ubiquitin carboxyl-terminal hydrolase 39 n=1 Tax=Trichostrongylus colubriformis TaxID=6319 RepID=A0AAN8FIR5_TRICO
MSGDGSSNSDSESVGDSKESANSKSNNHVEEGGLKRERPDDREKSSSPVAKKYKEEGSQSVEDNKPSKKLREEERDSLSKPIESRRSTKEKEKRDDDKKRSKLEKDKEKEREKDKKSRKERSRSRSRSPDTKRRRSDREKGKTKERKKENQSERKEKSKREKEQAVEDEKRNGDLEEGEVVEPAREPTARERERLRLIEQLAKEEAEENDPSSSVRNTEPAHDSRACPYLDTIDRKVLDFDFEKLCSVSLSHLNVYACMVCGKYFQGRGTNTHAYTHSLDTDHRVFLNLHTLKFYCLPDNYEVDDPSLEDIKYVLKPTYTKELIASLDRQHRMARAYDDLTYFPGVVGLNNIKANDYTNVVLHALSHVTPLRDYFLREENYENIKRPPGDKLSLLPKRFGELIRKLWNPKAFRTHVSPHEMLQATVLCSNKKFQFIKQGDAAEFMSFLLNTLHIALNGTQKSSSSIIYRIFRGRMRQYSRRVIPAEATEEQRQQLLQLPEYNESSKELPFLYLALDLPPAPLYRDEQMQNIIPQVPLSVLLQKFNGTTEKEYKTYNENIMKRFELLRLPEYLIITYKRFHKNQWFVEKNPTIVNFPISNVDLFDCLSEDTRFEHKYTTYDLVANIVHDGKPDAGTYRIQLVHVGSRKWFELEDLHVKEILPQMIVLAESYIQIWKLNRLKTREERMSEGIDDGSAS